MKNCFELRQHGLICEALRKAVLCKGTVYPWKYEYVRVFTGPRSWGHEVCLPAGSYLMERGEAVYLEKDLICNLDDPGDIIDSIAVTEAGLECVRRIAAEEGDTIVWRSLEDELRWREVPGGVCVVGCYAAETVAIPSRVGGRDVVRVELGADSLTEICRELVISEGIAEADIDLSAAPGLARLEIPSSSRLDAAPLGYELTNWYRRQKTGPVYLCGWYLGTPGGIDALGSDELAIEPGTVAVARGADFRCPWKSITVPDSVKSIGRVAFAAAPELERLVLPPDIEIGEYAFEYSPKLCTELPRERHVLS